MTFFRNIFVYLLFSNFLYSQKSIIDIEGVHPKTILFIGNSYLYYGDSLHNHFRRIVGEYFTGYDPSSVKSATIGGSRLKHHDVERLINPKAISSIEKFDLVILQGGSAETLTKESRKEFSHFIKKHVHTIRANNSKAALYMTHAYIEPHEKFTENQIKIIEKTYTKAGIENQVLVIPVGVAFDLAYKKNPNIRLHKSDGSHPSLLGTYLAACTVFSSIYHKSPVGIKYDYFGEISKEDKIFLQEVAYEATSKYHNK